MIVNFIRHGRTDANDTNVVSGGLVDRHLNENGKSLLRKYAEEKIYPENCGIGYVSELTRTKETFEIIYPGAEFIENGLLNERKFGILEFMDQKETLANMDLREKTRFESDFQPEGGESVNQFYTRVKNDFRKLLDIFTNKGYDIVTIVGHGGYLRGICNVFNVNETLSQVLFLIENGKGVTFDVEKMNDDYKIKIVSFIGGKTLEDIKHIRPKF